MIASFAKRENQTYLALFGDAVIFLIALGFLDVFDLFLQRFDEITLLVDMLSSHVS